MAAMDFDCIVFSSSYLLKVTSLFLRISNALVYPSLAEALTNLFIFFFCNIASILLIVSIGNMFFLRNGQFMP